MKSLSELRDEKALEYKSYFSTNATVPIYSFAQGFDAGAQAVIERAKVLVEAMKQSLDYAQDQLARANEAIATDCDKCDYQCGGCIRSIDDCDSLKKIVNTVLTDWANFVKGEK